MPGTMSQADLVADLRASLMDCANNFTTVVNAGTPGDPDFQRHLDAAADDLPRLVPEYNQDSLTLVAGQSLYAAPADLRSTHRLLWGECERDLEPWDPRFPGKLPRLSVVTQAAVRYIQLSPAPSQRLFDALGSSAPYIYIRLFVIGAAAADTTVPAMRRSLLLLRAQAEAMKELSSRGVAKPVQLRDGMTQGLKNATPAALFGQFMDECERQAA